MIDGQRFRPCLWRDTENRYAVGLPARLLPPNRASAASGYMAVWTASDMRRPLVWQGSDVWEVVHLCDFPWACYH